MVLHFASKTLQHHIYTVSTGSQNLLMVQKLCHVCRTLGYGYIKRFVQPDLARCGTMSYPK